MPDDVAHSSMTLPATPNRQGRPHVTSGTCAADLTRLTRVLTGVRVLLAEDNDQNAIVLERLLVQTGFQVRRVRSGRVAVEECLVGNFALVLMDCHLPEMDGYTAARQIRASSCAGTQTPIIALTVRLTTVEWQRCRDAGMNDYLVKPVTVDDLARVVRRWTCAASEESDESHQPEI